MKKAYIQIPEPCHQDWNSMTPVEQGRYCASCCKEVTDFSLMTDQEIIAYLSKPNENTCGRFAADQINRTISLPATPAKKRFWGMMLSVLVTVFASCKQRVDGIIGKFSASEEKEQVKEAYFTTGLLLANIAPPILENTVQHEPMMIAGGIETGKIEITESNTPAIKVIERFLKGIITDSSNQPIPFASIKVDGKTLMADSNGVYNVPITGETDILLHITSAGYKTLEIHVPLTDIINIDSIRRDIILIPTYKMLDDVVVLSHGLQGEIRFMAGGYSYKPVKADSPIKRFVDTVKHLLPSSLSVFPNPTSKGGMVQVKLNVISEFDLFLIDNNGRNILQNQFSLSSKNEMHRFQLPSMISSGMYFVKVIDRHSKKNYTSKLIVQ